MNQATIRALSQVGELVKEEKHDPRQKFIREKEELLAYIRKFMEDSDEKKLRQYRKYITRAFIRR